MLNWERLKLKMTSLNIPIAPVAASRPRVTRTGHAYDTKKYSKFKRDVKYWLNFNYKEELIEHKPIMIDYAFYRPIQSSISKKEHDRRKNNVVLPIVKPDLDNYIKAMQDCLTGHVIGDDNMVVDIHARKFYSDNPHIEVEIQVLGD